MHCLYHVLSQISSDCFEQQQDVFVVYCRQYTATIMLGQLSTCWYSCRVVSMKHVFGIITAQSLFHGVSTTSSVCCTEHHIKSVREISFQYTSMLVDPTCLTVTIQTLTFYDCFA